jgi:regulator of protease activity HflC (stomatin/prohibitin superfamily)
MESMYVVFGIAVLVLIVLAKTAVVVPQQSAYVVETLGRYNRTIQAGFHILKPFFDRVAYRHNLKEEAMDIPEQVCITRDNVQVGVDGVLYLQVLDASKASYGITNYRFAIIQLAQTTLRSAIGKIELDRTFEERATINANVVSELDKASAPWGVKVLRYEIKNINPPKDVLSRWRSRCAPSARSVRSSSRPRASATEAMQLRIAEEYVKQFGTLANEAASTLVVPANLTDIASMIALATSVVKSQKATA